MRLTFSGTCNRNASGHVLTGESRWTACVLLALVQALSCGHRDGIVGRINLDAGSSGAGASSSGVGGNGATNSGAGGVGTSSSGAGGTGAPVGSIFESEYVDNLGVWSIDRSLPNAEVRFGQLDPAARDGNVAELTFPGDPSRTASDQVGPAYVTQMATVERFSFGTLRTRVSFGSCAAGEEVIQSILGYFSDGSDLDRDGITDDLEIDVQFACGTPSFLYLTVFTDYQSTPTGERFQKLSHIVDLSNGNEYDSLADDSDEFVLTGTRPALAGLNRIVPGDYYVLGFTWQRDSIRFFLGEPNNEITLWTIDDPRHVPQQPVQLTYNLWHPDSHWYPSTGTADYPASDVVMRVDWIRYESFVTP